jgi:hypothetical protein
MIPCATDGNWLQLAQRNDVRMGIPVRVASDVAKLANVDVLAWLRWIPYRASGPDSAREVTANQHGFGVEYIKRFERYGVIVRSARAPGEPLSRDEVTDKLAPPVAAHRAEVYTKDLASTHEDEHQAIFDPDGRAAQLVDATVDMERSPAKREAPAGLRRQRSTFGREVRQEPNEQRKREEHASQHERAQQERDEAAAPVERVDACAYWGDEERNLLSAEPRVGSHAGLDARASSFRRTNAFSGAGRSASSCRRPCLAMRLATASLRYRLPRCRR